MPLVTQNWISQGWWSYFLRKGFHILTFVSSTVCLVSSFGSLEQMVVRFFVLFLDKTPDFILMI